MTPAIDSLKGIIANTLQRRTPHRAEQPGFRLAAVLLPLYFRESELHLLLTKRTDLVPTHKGQVSFPGGGFEERDGDLLATALRETEEEIGLRPERVEILGALDDTVTVSSRYVVRPFVGLTPYPYAYRLDPFEIERLVHLPMTGLLCGTPFREERWQRDGEATTVLFYDYQEHTVWGLTARILKQFVDAVRGPLRKTGLFPSLSA